MRFENAVAYGEEKRFELAVRYINLNFDRYTITDEEISKVAKQFQVSDIRLADKL